MQKRTVSTNLEGSQFHKILCVVLQLLLEVPDLIFGVFLVRFAQAFDGFLDVGQVLGGDLVTRVLQVLEENSLQFLS